MRFMVAGNTVQGCGGLGVVGLLECRVLLFSAFVELRGKKPKPPKPGPERHDVYSHRSFGHAVQGTNN